MRETICLERSFWLYNIIPSIEKNWCLLFCFAFPCSWNVYIFGENTASPIMAINSEILSIMELCRQIPSFSHNPGDNSVAYSRFGLLKSSLNMIFSFYFW